MILLTIPLLNYPAPKDKKKQKKKPIKKVPNSNPSTLIETSQQQVAFSNNRVQPRNSGRRADRVSDLRRSDLMTIEELSSNHNQNNNSASGRTRNLTRSEMSILIEDNMGRFRSEMSRGVPDLSIGWLRSEMSRRGDLTSEMSTEVPDLSRGVSDLSTIDEIDSDRNQNNNNAGERTQNLGMHTIVEEDIRRLRGNGNDLSEPIPGWQNPAVVRETTQSTQPQGNVTVIPIENDTNTVTIFSGSDGAKEATCCIGLTFLTVLIIIILILGLNPYKSKQAKVSISTNDSSSSNALWDDYDSHYDIDPQKVC